MSWAGSVVGGLAYQLSGVIGSYVQPGHDGKLFVTALLPLALLALVLAIRERRLEGHALLALTMGLALLSPHPQMAQYLMIAAGLFALYLAFGEPSERSARGRVTDIALALSALLLGFGIGAIQMLPSYEYIPFSPRAESYRGFEGATSYAIPWEHVPEFFLAGFVGQTGAGSYWGSNPLKLHSEYLGLPIVALAVLGLAGTRRRLSLWLGAIGLLFLLITLGASTPFYHLWYAVVPLVKQTRGPGMALYVVALVVSLFAALGVERLERGEGKRHATVWLAVGGAVALLALVGAFGGMASFLAQGLEQSGLVRQPVVRIAAAAGAAIRWGALGSGVALVLMAAIALAALGGRVKAPVLCLGLALLVSADMWRNARGFWVFSDGHRELHTSDQVTEFIAETPRPYRILNLATNDYPGSSLMTHDIPQLLGHHGNELHRFDELMGGKDLLWPNLGSLKLWDLFAVQYVIAPARSQPPEAIPGFTDRYRQVLSAAPTSRGGTVDVYSAIESPRYARLVPAAQKDSLEERMIQTLLHERFPLDGIVLLDMAAPVEPPALTAIPEPLASNVTFQSWEPGRMSLRIQPAAAEGAYLLISENWYKDWKATVDGEPAPVVRGDVSLLTVPVPAGAEVVELWFESKAYRLGKVITLVSLLLVVLAMVGPTLTRRQKGG